jgi:hypothetical protein
MGAFAFNLEPKITYTNVGNFPATSTYVTQSMFFANQTPGSDFLSDVKQRQRDLCENPARSVALTPFNEAYGHALYPGHDEIYSPGLGPSPPTREQVRPSDRIIAPVLIGCIFYRYLSSPTVHYTGFIFVIERGPKPWEGSGQGSYTLTYGEPVAIGDVVFADAYNGTASFN